MNNDLKKIKKYYGEDMMHLCRELFSTILEESGVLLKILEDSFPHSKYLYDDIIKDNQVENFKDFIYDKYNASDNLDKNKEVFTSPFELMDQAGYILFECHSEDDIQKFKKYYAPGEELCTFAGGRLDTSLVFFAVKKNADNINRNDFNNPKRQDEYGTSVISIQYRRGERNTLSIKNRYNHVVDNPDATFSNNLDNIIPGLNDSFEMAYNLSYTGSHDKFELIRYVRATDGKYYKYNYEINGVYYGPDNIIINNFEVLEKFREKEKYLLMDNFVIDLVNKKIFAYDNSDKYIENLNDIKKIEIKNITNGNKKEINLTMNNGEIVVFYVDRFNRIIKIEDNYTSFVPDESLSHSEFIKQLSMTRLVKCGDCFLLNNAVLNKIEMPEVRYIGDNFLRYNIFLREMSFPKLQVVGNCFMRANDIVQELYLPNVEIIGNNFMDLNRRIQSVILPNIREVGDWFFSANSNISYLEMPKLKKTLGNFLSNNKRLTKIYLPELVTVTDNFMCDSMVEEIILPKLTNIGSRFMRNNNKVSKIELPEVIMIGDEFMAENGLVNYIYIPKLISVGDDFMEFNNKLIELSLPRLEICGDNFISYNNKIERINLPMLKCIGKYFLLYCCDRNEIIKNIIEQGNQNSKKLVRKI